MKPVKQRYTVHEHGFGDCFNACISSILEKPIEECSDIFPNTAKNWYREWQKWLKQKGYYLDTCSKDTPPKGYSIISGETERIYPENHEKAGLSIYHAVVALDGQQIWDPYPNPSPLIVTNFYFTLTPIGTLDDLEDFD